MRGTPCPRRANCRIEAAKPPSQPGVFPMDIAIMVLAALFFFWQTITD
ncbi:hypothetical protein [Azospirillum doebereinerae]